MKVNEIFYSLQGEGARAGEASVFIRLSGCDQTCGFCDTEFASGKEMPLTEVLTSIQAFPAKWIIWTGGEPMVQLKASDVDFFRAHGYQQAIETNGAHAIPFQLDWIACSPKVAEHVLLRNFPNGVDELRYVRHAGQPMPPEPSVLAKRYFLSPMFRGNRADTENVKHCIQLCLTYPRWSLSLQTHKLPGVLASGR